MTSETLLTKGLDREECRLIASFYEEAFIRQTLSHNCRNPKVSATDPELSIESFHRYIYGKYKKRNTDVPEVNAHIWAASIAYALRELGREDLFASFQKPLTRMAELDLAYFRRERDEKQAPLAALLSLPRTGSYILRNSLGYLYEALYIPGAIRDNIAEMIPAAPEDEYPQARAMKRRFILHIGPTNSGKTYDALERLKTAQHGVYLGPLRLLALEVSDRLNAAGVPCSMVTGEEAVYIPGAVCTASTIEMVSTSEVFDIAVIDEAQMVADDFRGKSWTRAILGLCADEIHVCMAPEAEAIVKRMIRRCGDEFEIIRRDRTTPLLYDGSEFAIKKELEPGDALVTFSKKSVLALASYLQSLDIKCSIIYGSLPPETRKEQVRLFLEGQTEVIVSTDAIGMGLNLPIHRIIFVETQKFDGKERRQLTPGEVKQIAGRAGRFGLYEEGHVACLSRDGDYIEECLKRKEPDIKKARLGFPESLVSLDAPLEDTIKAWATMPVPDLYRKMNTDEMMWMLNRLRELKDYIPTYEDKEALYSMIQCPIDLGDREVVFQWEEYCCTYTDDDELPFPEGKYLTRLEEFETYFKLLDLYYNFSKRFHKTMDLDRLMEEKMSTAFKINEILLQDKTKFGKKCARCGRPLAWNYPYNICERCYERDALKGIHVRGHGGRRK